jgi:ADP-dependent NAD(P)H-hydrate dehydratase / NAD(P)H-hydrate epimerase
MKISTVKQMRELDRSAVERFGIAEEILMENAGQAAYFTILSHIGVNRKRFLVLCGAGNNGGDGFVVARKLLSSGGSVQIVILGDPGKYRGAARINLDIALALGIDIGPFDDVEALKHQIADADVVVDAIFGTGLDRAVEGKYRDVIDTVNTSGKKVVSLDIPSGVSGDTGRMMGTAIKADYTITFGLPKFGNLFYPGCSLCGEQFVTHISFPPGLYQHLETEVNVPPPLPPRDPSGHKTSFGQVLFIAGAPSYYGAPSFAAMSFLKSGGGYARLACPRSIISSIATTGREIVFVPQEETSSGTISEVNKNSLVSMSEKMDAVVIGPGLSLDPEISRLTRELTAEIKTPLLIDGDGLTAVSSNPSCVSNRGNATVLTPHPGEMARLTGLPVSKIIENPIPIVRDSAKKLHSIIVLKGARSIIAYPDGRVFVNLTGNSGMGTAGSGDVLTGTVAAMYCLGLPFEDAVRKAVFIHGMAGDIAAAKKGEDGITAGDILDCLPAAVKRDRETRDGKFEGRYLGPQVI